MDQPIKVILADDHQNILKNISSLLDNSPNIEVVGIAEDGEKAIALARSIQADILILDIDMPKLNGLQVLAELHILGINIMSVILTIYDEPTIVQAAFKQGAHGYVLKNRATADLVKAVQAVNAGGRFFSAPLSVNFS
jgi:DNA-binding NarL/FixJ family response regulator